MKKQYSFNVLNSLSVLVCLTLCMWTTNAFAQTITPPSSLTCNGGFLWENNIDVNSLSGSAGIPAADLRMKDGGTTSFLIPGPYPAEFSSAFTLDNIQAVSWDAYQARGGVSSQPNEQWKVVFKKNGSVVYTSSYTEDLGTGTTSAEWVGSIGSNVSIPNGVDAIYLVQYNDDYLGNGSTSTPNSVVPVSICLDYTPPCDNVTNAGQIGVAQSGCSPFDPATITSISDPSGGSGALEFVWLKSTNGGSSYTAISGADGLTYNPGSITETTWYRRCARRAGCSSYVGESNWVKVTVNNAAFEHISTENADCGGSNGRIVHDPHVDAGTELPYTVTYTYNGQSYTAGPFNENQDNYVDNLAPGTYSNVTMVDANGCEDNAGNLTIGNNTQNCCDNVTDAGEIGYPQTGCSPFDPAEIISVEDPSGGSDVLEFVWLKSTNGGSTYTAISGADGLTYNPGEITQTTWYRRCARRAGCSSYVGESNWVKITVGTTGVSVNVSKTDVTCDSDNSNECHVVHYQNGSHAVWLVGMSSGTNNYKFEGGNGTLVENEDGTAHFSGIVYNTSDSDKRWQVDINLNQKKTWSQWSSTGGQWKGDAGIVGNNYQDWSYYSFAAGSKLVGLGDWAGQELAISQMTGASQYAVQVGVAANDKNGNYGLSAWFDFSGTQNGHGDFNFDIQSCVEHGCDGTATASASGGTAPYTYLWDNGMTTSSIDELCAGQYCVSVVDANGCTSDEECVTIGDKPSCCNVTDPGEIAGGGSGCAPYVPTEITSVELPSGGSGDLEYVWLVSTNGGSNYSVISGANGSSYTPEEITETTWYRRCARREGCSSYVGESNWVQVVVTGPCCDNVTNPGSIAENQTNCGPFDVAELTNVVSPTGGSGNLEIIWITRTGTSGPWQEIPGSTGLTYNPGVVSATTQFRRCVRREGCSDFEESNIITVTIYPSLELSCNSTDASVWEATDGTVGIIVNGGTAPYTYLWNTGATTASIPNVSAGVYSVTVTDANGCEQWTECCVKQPSFPDVCIGFRTQTQGGWGSKPNGGNPGAYLHANFSAAFPSGIQIGCTNTFTFISAQAITDYLPCGGTPTGVPAGNATNPSCPGNVLSSQVLAASISVGFDNAIPNFSTSTVALEDLIIRYGTFQGWTVGELLQEANRKLGGCSSSYSYSELNNAVTAVNENYVDGNTTGNYLDCCNLTVACSSQNGTCSNGNEASASVNVTGGTAPYTYEWNNGATTASIDGLAAGSYSVTVTDANGCEATCTTQVSITPCCNVTTGGEIAGAQENCGPFDPAAFTSVSLPTGGLGDLEYVWMINSQNVPINNGNNGWVEIPNSNSATYDPGMVTETTCYLRCARREGCIIYPGESNVICVTINEAPVATCTPTDGTCANQNVASASVSASGGSAPYTYAWSNGATTASVDGLAAGSYSVTVTDANGCTAVCSTSVSITPCCDVAEPGTVAGSQEGCGPFDPERFTSIAPATGGLGDVVYQWYQKETETSWAPIPGATDETYDAGLISINTQFKRCARREGCAEFEVCSDILEIEIRPVPNATCTKVDGNCSNGNLGSASVSVQGGTAPYTYEWSNGETTASISGLDAGTYDVEVTDYFGCTSDCSVAISITPCCNVTTGGEIAGVQENCGPFDPAVFTSTSLPTGGLGDLEYVWMTNSQNVPINNGNNGWVEIPNSNSATYDPGMITETTCFIRCARREGCTIYSGESNVICVTVNESPVASCSSTDSGCNGAGTGTASVTESGGEAPYTYAWSNAGTTSTINGLMAGSYSVTVTDANGCTDDCTAVVGEPSGLTADCSATNASCNGVADGTIGVNATGGSAPYTYEWSNGATTASVSAVAAGNYSVTVTDANGCTATCQTTVGEPTALIADCTSIDGTCNNNNEASASVSVSGGDAPYSYDWSNGATTASIENLTAGTYSVTVTDANGCPADCSVTVSVTPCCNVTDGGEIAGSQENCGPFDPAAITSITPATGGLGDLEYIWLMNDENVPLNNGNNGWVEIAGSNSETYDPGMLTETTCFIRCARREGCTVYVGESNVICITVNPTVEVVCNPTNGDCSNNGVGAVSTSITGGTAPFTYAWSNGATTAGISGLTPGQYSVTVTDANGCVADCSVTIVSEPCCNVTDGGSITGAQENCGPFDPAAITSVVPATGGIGPVEYLWLWNANNVPVNNGQNGWVEIPNSNSATYDPGFLTESRCFIRCARNVGCTTYIGESNVVCITINEVPVATCTPVNGDCNNGNIASASVSVTGGTEPYAYEWSNGSTTASIDNIDAGTYSVTVTDANGCAATCTTMVELTPCCNVTDPGEIAANQSDCGPFDPEPFTSVAPAIGGIGPVEYVWLSGACGTPVNTWTELANSNSETYDAGMLTETTCFIRCARNVGCTDFIGESNIITVTVGPGCCDNVTDGGEIATSQENCGPFSPGAFTSVVDPTGGSGDLEYVWLMNDENVPINNGNNGWVEIPNSNSATYDPGMVTETTCFIRCARRSGCVPYIGESNVVCITINPADLAATCTPVNGDCSNQNEGSASVSVTGGEAPYTYEWSNGATTASIDDLTAGTYSVTVTDANGCTAMCDAVVEVAECCNVVDPGKIATEQENCGPFDVDELTDLITPTGGIGDLEIVWITRVGTTGPWQEIVGADGLTYDPGVISETTQFRRCVRREGCTSFEESNIITITILPAVEVECASISGDCGNGNLGSASVDVLNGTAPYSYQWNNGATTASIENLAEGTYTVTVTDENGCQATCTEEVIVTPCCNVTDPGEIAGNEESCSAFDPRPFTSVSPATGGIGPVEYRWLQGECGTPTIDWTVIPNSNSETIDVGMVSETTCLVRQARNSGCQPWIGESNIITITIQNALTIECSSISGDCGNGNVASASVDVIDGTAPFAYEWSNGETTQTINNLAEGTYAVTVTDANGCSASCTEEVIVTPCCNITDPGEIAASQTNCGPFDPAPFTSVAPATGGIGPVEYMWLRGECGTPVEQWTEVPNANSETLDVDSVFETTCFIRCARNSSCEPWVGESNIITVTVYPAITLSCNGIDGDCTNDNIAKAVAHISGGVEPYAVAWSNGEATATIDSLEAGTYTVVVTDANGCVDSCSVDVEVIPCCNVTDGGEIAEDQENCGPFDPNAIVSVAPATGGIGPVEYAWYSGACSEVVSPTFAPTPQEAIPSGFTLIAGATGESYDPDTLTETTCFIRVARNEGCTDWIGESNIVTITIYEVPTVDVAITGGVNPTCSGSEVELTATSSTGTSFEWSTGETTSSIMVTESGQYCATTVSVDGCEATACIDIIVNPTPDVEVEVTAGSNPLCPGNEVELTAVSQTAVGYEWSTTDTTSSIVVEIAGTYIVEVTDVNGCTASASIEVEAGLVPVVEIEGVPEFCTGDSVMLTAQTADGEGFTWSTGETTQNIWVNTAGEYCVMTASVDGCEVQACIEVEEAAIPEVYAGEDINICVEQSAVLTATGGTSGTIYTWYVDGQEVGTGETIVVSPGIGITEYQVVAVNDNCSISDEDFVKVYVYDYPLAGFERDPAGDVPYGEDVLFTDTTQGNVTDWHWDFGDGMTSMLQNPDHNYADPGSYWVTLIASNNGCEDTVTAGLEVKIIIDIPNVFTPNNDGMNDEIWIQGTDLDMISMTIYNRWGHSVYSGEGRQFSWSGKTMEGTDCEVGTYYYVIQMTYKDGNISEQTGFFTLLRNN